MIAFSSFAYGYAGAIIATTLTQPSFVAAMGLDKASNEASLIGAINGLYYAGGVFGAFTGGWLSNKWGRKFSAIVGNIILLLSAAVMTGGVHVAMFITFRFCSGVGCVHAFSIGYKFLMSHANDSILKLPDPSSFLLLFRCG